MKRPYKVVEVEWFDAQSSMSIFHLEELKEELRPIISYSVGYLLHEEKDHIVLGFLLFGNELIKHHQVIPKGMIKKIKVLRKEVK